MRTWTRTGLLVALVVVAGVAAACSSDSDGGAPEADPADPSVTVDEGGEGASAMLKLEAVSTRAEHVTGGDVLVALTGAADVVLADGFHGTLDNAGDDDESDDDIAGAGDDTDTSDDLIDDAGSGIDSDAADDLDGLDGLDDNGAGGTTVVVELTVDGEPATVTWRDDGNRLLGLVEDLEGGEHELVARIGDHEATLTVVDHPSTGPVFSGPHLPLVACSTETFDLGPAIDDDCSAEQPQISWSYVTNEGERVDLEDPNALPDDIATMADGETPFVLREERGTINRAVYWITVPDPTPGVSVPDADPVGSDPDATGEPTTANVPGDGWDASAWNGRLVYEFGGGCGTTYTQGFTLLGRPDLEVLAEGYGHATATFNTFQVLCNAVVSAETTMMVTEHFAERYAPPELTIGTGGSGGAIQQYQILQNYPGLLDASAALLPFPDALSIAGDVVDCGLLVRFFGTDAAQDWSDEARRAVTGHANATTCNFWEQTFVPGVDPAQGCALPLLEAAGDVIDGLGDRGMPASPDQAVFFDPDDNPEGLRCTLQDSNVNVLGTDPDTGAAQRPWDNTGIVYGLGALADGAIDVDQLLDLNEGIGNYGIDGPWEPGRARATDAALDAAHASGGITEGAGDLRRVPLITVDLRTDDQGDIHTRERAFVVRERLRLPDGSDPPNHMLWTRGLPEGDNLVDSLTGSAGLGLEVIAVLDEWATATADSHAGTGRDEVADAELAELLEAARPEAAVDNCITPDGERASGLDLYEQPGPCRDLFPVSDSPRTVAGAPLRNDILACAVVPTADADLPVDVSSWSDAQQDRFAALFPDGVCDWSAPGRGVVPFAGPWQDHGEP